MLRMLVVALAAAALGPVDALAQPSREVPPASAPGLHYKAARDGFVISIRVHDGAPVSVRQDGRDLLVSFADAAPAFDAADLQRHAADWLDGVSVGYDSLLLRLARGVRVRARVESTRGLVMLWLDAVADASVQAEVKPPPPAERAGALRLELLVAQLLLRDQQLAQARERFTSLRTVMAGQPEPVAGLAAVEWQAGSWRRSLALYREAAALDSDNPDLSGARRAIERSQASRASLVVEARRSRGGELDAPVTVRHAEAKGLQRIDEAWRVDLDADVATVRTDSVRRASGALEAFSGQRSRAVVSAQHDGVDGAVTAGSLFLGRGSAGLGLLRRQPDDSGATSLVVEGARHNWDYVEGLIDGALRDRIAIGRTQRLGTDLGGRVELGYNRYHRPEEAELGRSASLAAELRLDRLAGVAGLAAAYALDGEYIDRRSTRLTAAGQTFAPLPLVNREVHSVTIGYARSVGDRWTGHALTFDGYAGLASDRHASSGLVAAATLTYASGPLELQIRGSRVHNVGSSRGSTDAVGAVLSILF